MKMIKVSFDFDGTLDRESVQKYASKLIAEGIDVWITTSRMSDKDAPSPNWNCDLFEVAQRIGIAVENIRFTGMADKYVYFKDNYFIWHLDDDWTENKLINNRTKTRAISHMGAGNWIGKCERLINKTTRS
jgi:uncharacterized protein YvpB